MKNIKSISIFTVLFFTFTLFPGSYAGLFSQSKADEDEIARLLGRAEENYQNGNFKEAIEIYQEIINSLREKKELVETKQKLFQTMTSLALTYFTIQENDKARAQLEKLLEINPRQELDPEFYPPKFMTIFNTLQQEKIGKVYIDSSPPHAAIYLNDKKIGETPIQDEKWLAGEYELKAQLKGYRAEMKTIKVTAAGETRVNLALQKTQETKKTEEKQVIEKPAQAPKKKKKKISPLLIAGGVAVVVAAVLLLSGKGDKKEPEQTRRVFENHDEVAIPPNALLTVSPLEVAGLPRRIERLEYRVLIDHPNMADLVIRLIGPRGTSHTIWSRTETRERPKEIRGSTTIFNSVDPNGTWRVSVVNHGPGEGRIVEWGLIFFYTSN